MEFGSEADEVSDIGPGPEMDLSSGAGFLHETRAMLKVNMTIWDEVFMLVRSLTLTISHFPKKHHHQPGIGGRHPDGRFVSDIL